MCDDWRSWWRNDASVELRRSLWPADMQLSLTRADTMRRMRPLFAVLSVQIALGAVFVVLVVSGALPFTSGGNDSKPGHGAARVDRFDGAAAFRLLKLQVGYGPRPAGAPASRRVAGRLATMLPDGRFQEVPGGLRNVVGTVPGRDPRRYVVVGAHYDTKEIPGFVGANDGASGTAVLTQLAHQFARAKKKPRHTLVFVAFDGEESPRPSDAGGEARFEHEGLRGSKVAAERWRNADAMVLLDFVGDRHLSTPREANSSRRIWSKLRAAAKRVGVGSHFPASTNGAVSDDHVPFIRRGVPSIDLIDFGFPCWHQACDDLSAVSGRSVDVSGEAVRE